MITRSSKRNPSLDWLSLSSTPDPTKWVSSPSTDELFGRYFIAPKSILVKSEVPDYLTDLGHILDVVRESRRILELEEDWDDEGSPGYTETTWKNATDFLLYNALRLWRNYRVSVEAPRVLPGPDGSIDIHWRVNNRELLVNIPANDKELATYYGDNKAGSTVKGSLDSSARNEWLMMWLAE